MNELIETGKQLVLTNKVDASGTWTHLWDMSSGGYHKADFHHIFIQAPANEAVQWANWKWDIHPDNITCSCCGQDYGVIQGRLGDIAAFHFTKCSEHDDDGYGVPEKEIVRRVFQCVLDGGEVDGYDIREKQYALFVFRSMMGKEYKKHYTKECSYVTDYDDE